MRRFLLAAGLAVLIHGLFLSTEPEWLKKRFAFNSTPDVVTLKLAFHKPQASESKTVMKRPETPKKSLEPVTKTKETKHTTEQMPQKPAKSLVSSKPEPIIKSEQHEVLEKPSDIRPDSARGILREGDIEKTKKMVSIPPETVIREARPIYRRNPPPGYPRLARKRGYQGSVVLEVLVDRKGMVADLRIFTSTGYPILDRAAMDSVKKWLFEPGVKGSKKVEMWVRVPICFQLK